MEHVLEVMHTSAERSIGPPVLDELWLGRPSLRDELLGLLECGLH